MPRLVPAAPGLPASGFPKTGPIWWGHRGEGRGFACRGLACLGFGPGQDRQLSGEREEGQAESWSSGLDIYYDKHARDVVVFVVFNPMLAVVVYTLN